jgi:hypothetical protein
MIPYDVLKLKSRWTALVDSMDCILVAISTACREGGMACISLRITRTNETSAIGNRYFSVSKLVSEID